MSHSCCAVCSIALSSHYQDTSISGGQHLCLVGAADSPDPAAPAAPAAEQQLEQEQQAGGAMAAPAYKPWRDPLATSEAFGQLEALMKERIIFIDGAMGTMIQRYKLEEADFRGDRCAEAQELSSGLAGQ